MNKGATRLHCCLLTSLTALALVVFARGETVDRFVTAIESPSAFTLGSMHFVLGPKTLCANVTLTTAEVRHNFLWNNFRYLPPEYVGNDSASATVPSCQTLHLSFGTWVHIEDSSQQQGEVWFPEIVVAYRYPIAIERLESCSLLEETPKLEHAADGWHGTVWVDGYPMQYGLSTQIFEASTKTEVTLPYTNLHSTPFHRPFHQDGQSVPDPSADQLKPNMWTCYRAGKTEPQRHALTRLIVWPNRSSKQEQKLERHYSTSVQMPDYARGLPLTLQLGKKTALQIVPSAAVQSCVTEIGQQLIPKYETALALSDPTRTSFHFYVTRPLYQRTKRWRLLNNPYRLNIENTGSGRPRNYNNWVLALPGGTIIITDAQLARLHNTAQLAALLSFAVTSVLQKQTYIRFEFDSQNDGGPDDTPAEAFWQDGQRLRIGIRQMYLAGYDIREAPFAWALASGQPAPNPVINSATANTKIPWYTAYAFNTISQFYSDVDYGKLKRGKAEYAQFLDELRKADPEAFAPPNPQETRK